MLLEFQNSIIQGNCRKVLSELPANFIQLTITSPPYRNAIDYEAHVEKNGYYRGKTRRETAEYLEEMVDIFNNSVYRVTKDGGYCCIVIGNEVVNGTIIPLPHMLLSKLVQPFGNWNLHEEIIWHKVTGGTNRYGSFVINPYPKYFRANIMHEFILVLRKGDVKSGRTNRRDILPAKHEEFTKEIANSVCSSTFYIPLSQDKYEFMHDIGSKIFWVWIYYKRSISIGASSNFVPYYLFMKVPISKRLN